MAALKHAHHLVDLMLLQGYKTIGTVVPMVPCKVWAQYKSLCQNIAFLLLPIFLGITGPLESQNILKNNHKYYYQLTSKISRSYLFKFKNNVTNEIKYVVQLFWWIKFNNNISLCFTVIIVISNAKSRLFDLFSHILYFYVIHTNKC